MLGLIDGDIDGLMLGLIDGLKDLDIDFEIDGLIDGLKDLEIDLDMDGDMDGLKLALVAAPTVKLLAAVHDP